MTAPERIWRHPEIGYVWDATDGATPYIREDSALAAVANQDETIALLRSVISECDKYLKPGETPRERMDRDFADHQALLAMLEKTARGRAAALAALTEAREALAAHRETFIAAGAMPFADDVLLAMTDAALARIDALKGDAR